jgi:hypothetical protein
MVRPSGTEAPGARRCGQADALHELRARVSSWPPLGPLRPSSRVQLCRPDRLCIGLSHPAMRRVQGIYRLPFRSPDRCAASSAPSGSQTSLPSRQASKVTRRSRISTQLEACWPRRLDDEQERSRQCARTYWRRDSALTLPPAAIVAPLVAEKLKRCRQPHNLVSHRILSLQRNALGGRYGEAPLTCRAFWSALRHPRSRR